MQIDDRIKQAQRRGAGVYLFGAFVTVLVVATVMVWLFLVRAYVLKIGPDEASPIAIATVESGFAWVRNNQVYTLGGDVSIQVQADTFEPKTIMIDANSPTNIEVVLAPSPAIINANLNLQGETSWYVNNELIFVGNDLEHAIAHGEYQIRIENPYYKPVTLTQVLQRAQSLTLSPEFERVQGRLSVSTIPLGTQISINGEPAGEVPLEVELSGGEHLLSAELEGYQTLEDTLEITYSLPNIERNYQLQAVQSYVDLSAEPSGGVLLINKLEKAPGRHSLDANTEHLIEYRKAGFFPFSERLTLAPNETRPLAIQLSPELGSVRMSANIQASLSINGAPSGLVGRQLRIVELSAKPTQIVVSQPGYRSVTKTITPTSERALELKLELLTEFDARRKEGRPLIATQLGINLRKFRPSAFTMGSPPNESGRRRNEHQLDVDFDRDIWVSEHEITQAQYSAFTGTKSTSRLPQTNITWEQAALFSNWLSQQEALSEFYVVRNGKVVGFNQNALGYRLPTEAEWEWLAKKAKRAQSTTYVWGNQTRIPTQSGNFADESAKANQLIFLKDYDDKNANVSEVGSFKADRNGLYDLAGNVSEWVHDYYATAIPDTDIVHMNYMGASRGTQHVVKGGNYTSGRLRELRGAFREVGESAKPTIGFRIARYDN